MSENGISEAEKEALNTNLKMFASFEAPSFRMRLSSGTIQFNNGVLKLDISDENEKSLYNELIKLLKNRGDLRVRIRYVDRTEAIKVAKEHKAKAILEQGASTGPVSSADVNKAKAEAILARRDAELAGQGATPEQLQAMNKELEKDDLHLTEKSSAVVHDTKGFIPDNKPEEVVNEPSKKSNLLSALIKK